MIASIANEARALEQARQYDQALVKWEALRSTYRHYPDLDRMVERVKKLREQAQADARSSWVEKIESAMMAADYVQVSTLVAQAEQEFPWDADLMEFKQKAAEGLKLRAKAQKGLAEGQRLLANRQWEEGAGAIVRACRAAVQDRMIQERGANELLQACKTASEKDWRGAEILLRELSELQPASVVPPELEVRIRELKKEESLAEALSAARRMQSAGDLAGSARELARGLASYPEESRLLTMQRAVEEQMREAQAKERLERARQEKEAFVKEVIQRAQQEPGLDSRIHILEEALRKEPGEARLQRQLNEVRDLAKAVASLASEARSLEQTQKYEQALAKWEALRGVFRQYPDLEKLIEQTRERQRQAQVEARGKLVREIQSALGSANYEQAEHLLAQAKRDFPGDRELGAIEHQVGDRVGRRAEGQKHLASAMKAVGKAQWLNAAESFQAAYERADADPLINDQVLRGFLQASEAALKSDLEAADMLFGEAVRLQPESPLLAPLKGKIEAHKREGLIGDCLNAATRSRAAGDLAGALQELDRGLSKYPGEARLLRQKEEIEKQAGKQEEEQRQAREQELHRRMQTQVVRAVPRTWSEQEGPKEDEPPGRPAAHSVPADQLATQLFDPQITVVPAQLAQETTTAKPIGKVPPTENPKAASPGPAFASEASDVARAMTKAEPFAAHTAQRPTRSSTAGDPSAEWDATLRAIEKELAAYIGPLARIVVKRAAAKTTDPDELYSLVAQSLEREEDRDAFLARQSKLTRSWPKPQTLREAQAVAPLTAAVNPLSPLGITQEAIDHAAHMLAAHVGPISSVLAKKAARRADSVQTLYRLLAEHVQNGAERRRFLRDAGFPDA